VYENLTKREEPGSNWDQKCSQCTIQRVLSDTLGTIWLNNRRGVV